jgi:phage tail sheath gpL-like
MAACINANTTLSPHLLASAASGVVTLTAKLKGSLGNLIVMSTSDATAFTLVQPTGGAGGPTGTAVNFNNTTTIS